MNDLSLTLTKSLPKRFQVRIPVQWAGLDAILMAVILTGSISVFALALRFDVFLLWREFLSSFRFLVILGYFLLFSSGVIVSGLVFRTILWMKYKPMALNPAEDSGWPFVSVIMPALNEEESIQAAIDSIFSSRYPQNKLEVICIDDGSADSTFLRMMAAKQRYQDRIKVIRFAQNSGKRKALYTGIKTSRGEVIVTVDSDSQVDPEAIRNVVVPLIKEKNCGAVAGRVEVLNKHENFLTRMLSVRYSLSFNFGRAYQSVYGAVFCCPGALTAYRKNVLMKFLDQWINQTFLNTRCTYGEDRALTTLALKHGYMTRFQSNAIVFTQVPSKFSKMVRMYLRWSRSCVRETILFAGFMFTKYRENHRVLPLVDFFFLNILHPFHFVFFGILLFSVAMQPLLLIRYVAVIVGTSFFLSLYYLRAQKDMAFLYGIPYGILTAFCLWWIFPFAAFTVKNKSWMTR